MTASNLANVVDRLAVSLMNTLVVVGLPLVALGLLTRTL